VDTEYFKRYNLNGQTNKMTFKKGGNEKAKQDHGVIKTTTNSDNIDKLGLNNSTHYFFLKRALIPYIYRDDLWFYLPTGWIIVPVHLCIFIFSWIVYLQYHNLKD